MKRCPGRSAGADASQGRSRGRFPRLSCADASRAGSRCVAGTQTAGVNPSSSRPQQLGQLDHHLGQPLPLHTTTISTHNHYHHPRLNQLGELHHHHHLQLNQLGEFHHQHHLQLNQLGKLNHHQTHNTHQGDQNKLNRMVGNITSTRLWQLIQENPTNLKTQLKDGLRDSNNKNKKTT